jgi:hypothetical protein
MSNGSAKTRWHQFTIKRLMIATFWLAISCGMLIRLIAGTRDHSLSRQQGWLLFLVSVMSACLAIGSLFKRTLLAAIIGAIVVLVLWAMVTDVVWSS